MLQPVLKSMIVRFPLSTVMGTVFTMLASAAIGGIGGFMGNLVDQASGRIRGGDLGGAGWVLIAAAE